MAECKCGTTDKSLPAKWVNWECPRCFIERSVTYTTPFDPEFTAFVIYDLESKLKFLNMKVIDTKIEAGSGF